MPAGRPSTRTPEVIEAARAYVNGGWQEAGDSLPTMAGLAVELGYSRETLRLWSKDEGCEIVGILQDLEAIQERILVNKGLSGEFVSPIVKVMIGRHGWKEKTETESTFTVNLSPEDSKL